MTLRNPEDERARLVMPIAFVITCVWGIAAMYALVSAEYRVLEIVTAPFLLVSGYVFGIKIIRNKNGS